MPNNWNTYIEDLPDFPKGNVPWEPQFINAVLSNIPKQGISKILEVGCSNGRWLRWFNREYKASVFGLDNNSTGFKNDDIIKFEIGDARKMPFKENSFDLVLSMGLIEHFKKEEKLQILREQTRVLRKGGYLVCQAPYLGFCLNYLYTKYAYDLRKGTKHFRTTNYELKRYFNDLGLRIVFDKHIGSLMRKTNRLLATEILIIAQK